MTALALVTVLGCSGSSASPSGRIVHEDGGGPLASYNDPNSAWNYGVSATTVPWAVATPLCLVRDGPPAVIDSIYPLEAKGDGLEYLGSKVRLFTVSKTNAARFSYGEYPPRVPEPLYDAIGYSVTTVCPSDDGWANPYVELIIGFAGKGDAGGAWEREAIDYHIGSSKYTLVLKDRWVLCGTSTAAESLCEPAASPSEGGPSPS